MANRILDRLDKIDCTFIGIIIGIIIGGFAINAAWEHCALKGSISIQSNIQTNRVVVFK